MRVEDVNGEVRVGNGELGEELGGERGVDGCPEGVGGGGDRGECGGRRLSARRMEEGR